MMDKRFVRYERKLSGIERYSLAINEIYRYNVDGLIIGTGELTIEELRYAVAAAAKENPGMRVRLRAFLGFAKWVDSGIPPEVWEVDAPDWDFRSERGAEFLQKRFEPLSGTPIADVILVRGKNKIGVIFRGLHAAVDGRGMMHWIHEVFRALRGENLLGAHAKETDFDVAVKFREKCLPDKKITEKKQAKEKEAAPIYMPVVAPSEQGSAELHYMWRTVAIPKRITTILPRAAIYLARYARRQGDGVVGFTVPVDYRGLRVEASSTGNLTGYLRIHVGAEDTPKTIMQQLNQQIREYLDCRLAIMANPLRWIPLKSIVRKLSKNMDKVLYTQNADLPTGGLVSMGHTERHNYSGANFSGECLIGIPGSVGKLNVVAINYPETTYVTFSAPKNYNCDGQVDRMIDDFAAEFSR